MKKEDEASGDSDSEGDPNFCDSAAHNKAGGQSQKKQRLNLPWAGQCGQCDGHSHVGKIFRNKDAREIVQELMNEHSGEQGSDQLLTEVLWGCIKQWMPIPELALPFAWFFPMQYRYPMQPGHMKY